MSFPKTLLSDVAWSLAGDVFDTLDEFAQELRDYQPATADNPSFDPAELVLLHPTVILLCDGEDEDGDDAELEAALRADDGLAFSAAELLFKAHNAFVDALDGLDHHFFEGLMFDGLRDGTPIYRLRLGS